MIGLPREADLAAGVAELCVAATLGGSHSRGFD